MRLILRDAALRKTKLEQDWRVVHTSPHGMILRPVRKDTVMFLRSRSLLLTAALLAAPVTTVLAQQNNPMGNMGSNNSVTATPGTADNKASSGMNTADTGARGAPVGNYTGSSMNPTTPGATGKAVVPGSTSSQVGSSAGTVEQKAGPQASGGK